MSFKNSSLSLVFMFSFFFPYGNSLFFNISSFNKESTSLIEPQGDAFINAGRIKLTEDTLGTAKQYSEGRAVYKQEVILYDEKSGELTDFTTHFSFVIKCVNESYSGDGFTFFLAKYSPTIPEGSGGGLLALYGPDTDFSNSENGVVAVEFDSFQNDYDPSANHIGIDLNSVQSVATVEWNSSIKDGRTANAWVTYNSTTQNISVFLTYHKNPIYTGNPSLSYNVDLRDYLLPKVAIGFSAATGSSFESHEIISWSFSSNLEEKKEDPKKPQEPKKPENPKKEEKPEEPEEPKKPQKTENPEKTENNSENANRSKVGLIVGLAASFGTILLL